MDWLDNTILGVYFAAVLALGLWAGRCERDTKDYFLGGRRQHWLLAGISIIATEISALTYVGVPADSFRGDCNYLQMYFGSFVGRILIVFLLLPAYYGGSVTTVYEYLGQRFGPATRTSAALLFLFSRVLGSGIRLLAGSLAVAVVFDWPLVWVIVGSAGVSVLYAAVGGIKAILWTDLLQAFLFLGAAVAVVVFLLTTTPGSWTENLSMARDANKFHVFTWLGHPNDERVFWVLFIHTVVMNMAAMGCDQDLTQRMLTCRDLREGQKSVVFNAFVTFPIVCLFLMVGVFLFVYYQVHPNATLPEEVQTHTDRVFPWFIASVLPSGFRGLLVTAIFAASMSSLASAVGALSSSAVTDFYRPLVQRWSRGQGRSERHYLAAGRLLSVVFGVLLVLVALAFVGQDRLLWEAFRLPSLLFGGMLGVFLLGVTTKRRGLDRANPVFMLSSVVLLVALRWVQDYRGETYVAWPWWVVIGTAWTYGWGICLRTRSARGNVTS
jgi:SSS family transporter